MSGWSIGDWQVGHLTDAELRKGIARYESALRHHEADAPVRATIAEWSAPASLEAAVSANRRAAMSPRLPKDQSPQGSGGGPMESGPGRLAAPSI
jgi:hypothetical protein